MTAEEELIARLPKPRETWKHMLTLGVYRIMGVARFQIQSYGGGENSLNDTPCVVYQSVDNGLVFCRLADEFLVRYVKVEEAPA